MDVPVDLRRYVSEIDHFEDRYYRLSWELPSRAITAHIAKDGYWYIHPDKGQAGTLSVREAAREAREGTYEETARQEASRQETVAVRDLQMPARLRLMRLRVRRRYPKVVWAALFVATMTTLMRWAGLRPRYFWGDPISLGEALGTFLPVAVGAFLLLLLWPWRDEMFDR
jgi:hypothetical protein